MRARGQREIALNAHPGTGIDRPLEASRLRPAAGDDAVESERLVEADQNSIDVVPSGRVGVDIELSAMRQRQNAALLGAPRNVQKADRGRPQRRGDAADLSHADPVDADSWRRLRLEVGTSGAAAGVDDLKGGGRVEAVFLQPERLGD